MATTVSYKGSTIATVSNQTKTLTTSGKYMEADVVITDSGGTVGVDCPVFTITYTGNDWTYVGITCNKTYAECLAYGVDNQNNQVTNAIAACVDVNTSTNESSTSSVTLGSFGQEGIRYIWSDGDSHPYFDILYSSNGTITQIEPSTRSLTLNATANGTYTPNLGVYTEVNVNLPTMTLPTNASSTSSGTSKATISRSTSAQYINIPTGYNATASYYTISATPNMTLPTSASSTSSGTAKATITPGSTAQYINIPTGYNGTASYYTISAVTYSTITVSSSSPSGGNNGDVWIVTS